MCVYVCVCVYMCVHVYVYVCMYVCVIHAGVENRNIDVERALLVCIWYVMVCIWYWVCIENRVK